MKRHSLTLALLLVLSTHSSAHLLKVFAYTQPLTQSTDILIQGKVYFAGGAGVPQLALLINDLEGSEISSTTTNAQGKFSVNLPQGSYQIIANTLDGHKAVWDIKQPGAATLTATTPQTSYSTADIAVLETLLAGQLAEQIAPLMEKINQLEEKAGWQDMLGAIGYIFGLFGLTIWIKQRHLALNS